ncbi:MAG: hypothetical protein QW540_01550 [Archaeoglobaceae archaeon]
MRSKLWISRKLLWERIRVTVSNLGSYIKAKNVLVSLYVTDQNKTTIESAIVSPTSITTLYLPATDCNSFLQSREDYLKSTESLAMLWLFNDFFVLTRSLLMEMGLKASDYSQIPESA